MMRTGSQGGIEAQGSPGGGNPSLRAVLADLRAAYSAMHPYDIQSRRGWADELLEKYQGRFPKGSAERAQFLLTLLHYLYPSTRLSRDYFDTLRAQFADRPQRHKKGEIVLGIGTGRCGSTSLALSIREVEGAIATHETPPMIFWQPQAEQIEFHFQRLEFLAAYFSLVFDASHWWLNVIDPFLVRFPEAKVVGLYRNMESCVNSFLKIKGIEAGSLNHWAPPDDPMWTRNYWDPTYPSFEAPERFSSDPFRCKGTQIQWYVDMYHERLQALSGAHPDRVLLVSTDSLGEPQTGEQLSAFIGTRIALSRERINSSSMASIEQEQLLWF